jgi:hypothetical protein
MRWLQLARRVYAVSAASRAQLLAGKAVARGSRKVTRQGRAHARHVVELLWADYAIDELCASWTFCAFNHLCVLSQGNWEQQGMRSRPVPYAIVR